MRLFQFAALAFGAGLTAGAAQAAVITDITVNPLTGSIAVPGDGVRTVVNSNFMLDSFEVGAGGDRFRFLLSAFGIDGGLDFVNTTANLLPPGGANLIVLQDATDGVTGTLNAVSSANLIAAETEVDGAGFFVYFNTVLDINRLVFSENLNVPTADLAILAFINNPKGADAIADLPGFSNLNFAAFAEQIDVAPVPLPATAMLLVAAIASLGLLRRRA